MDLGKCPGCGEIWPIGQEICPHCGSVAIGAGLRRNPLLIRFRRRADGKEYWSYLPFLGLVFGVLLAVAMYQYQPWQEDWQALRTLLFKERPTEEILGRWEVTRVLRPTPAAKRVIPAEATTALFNFQPNGIVYVRVSNDKTSVTYQGIYNQRETNLFLSNMSSPSKPLSFPSQALATATRTNEQGLVLTFGKEETLFLRPISDNSNETRFSRVGEPESSGRRRR